MNTQFLNSVISTQERVCKFINENIKSFDSVSPNHNVLIDLGFKSLDLMRLTSFIFNFFNVVIKFSVIYENPIIKDICKIIDSQLISSKVLSFKASDAQERICIDDLILNRTTNIYNMGIIVKYDEDIGSLKHRIDQIINAHSILRTALNFNLKTGSWTQTILNHPNFLFEEQDNIEDINNFRIKELNNTRFKIDQGECIKCIYIKQQQTCLFIFHHAYFDGFSLGIFKKELCSKEIIKPLPFQYINYTIIENDWFQTSEYNSALHFWTEFLYDSKDYITPIQTSRPRQTFRDHTCSILFQKNCISLDSIIKYFKLTSNMLFNLLFGLMIMISYNHSYYQLGNVYNNRNYPGLEQLIGMFVNHVVIKLSLKPEDSLSSYIIREKKVILNLLRYAHIPINHIMKKLDVYNVNGLFPIFQTSLGIMEQDIETMSNIAKYDLYLFHKTTKESTTIGFRYTIDIFDENIIQPYLTKMNILFNTICSSYKTINLCDINLVLEEQGQYGINEMNYNNELALFQEKTCSKIILDYSSQYFKTALIFKDTKISYKELIEKAKYVAFLLYKKGIIIGDIVVQSVERSIEMIIGMLGIIFSGAVYCPVHPLDPIEKINHIIKLTETKVILTTTLFISNISYYNTSFIDLEKIDYQIFDYDLPIVHKTNVLYMITTSGTTGEPKMIEILQESLLNYIYNLKNIGFKSDYKYLQFCRCSFDPHIRETLGTLLLNGTIVMIEDMNARSIHQVVDHHKVDVINCVPSYVQLLCDTKENYDWKSVKIMTIIGEALLKKHIENIYAHLSSSITIYNLYGPAECTIDSCFYKVENNDFTSNSVPIGKSFLGCYNYILDQFGNVCNINVIGELYIGGICVMKGYYKNIEQTNKSIIYHPKYNRLYKTGDLSYVTEDGNIMYIGRNDFQIKIRGQRVEITEIELVIKKSKEPIKDILILKINDNIVCFILGKNINIEIIEKECKKYLLKWMIPSYFITIENWPLTINGKVNRKELIKYYEDHQLKYNNLINNQIIIPNTQIDINIWNCIIKTNSDITISPNMNVDIIYDLSFNSINTMIFYHYISEDYTFLELTDLLRYTNLKDLSLYIETHQNKCYQFCYNLPQLTKQDKSFGPSSDSQQSIFIHNSIFEKYNSVYNVNFNIDITKSQLVIDNVKKMYIKLLTDMPIFRTYFKLVNDSLYQYYKDIETIDINKHCILIETENECSEYISKLNNNYIDINSGPLLNIYLIVNTKNPDEKYFIFQIHHIIYDHGCDKILFSIINSILNDETYKLESIFTYLDYSIWEQSYLKNSTYYTDALQFWDKYLDNEYIYTIILDPTYIKTNTKGLGKRINWEFSDDITAYIKNISKQNKITIHTLLLFIFSQFLHKLSNENIFYLGGNFHNRIFPHTEHIFGYFMNKISYKSIYLDESIDGIQWWKQNSLDVYKWGIVNPKIKYNKDSKLPFSSCIITEIPYNRSYSIKNGNFLKRKCTTTVDDILFYFWNKDNIGGCFEYDISIFNEEYIKLINKKWYHWNNQIIHNKYSSNISNLDLLLPEEHNLYSQINYKITDEYKYSSIHENIIDIGNHNSNKIALIFETQSITYKELLEKAKIVAFTLIHTFNINKGDIIIQSLDRSIEMVIGFLSILLTGAVYFPFHPLDINDRFYYLYNLTETKLILTTKNWEYKMTSLNYLSLDTIDYTQNINNFTHICNDKFDVLYIITTSGTTGQPKCIQITHDSFLDYVNNLRLTIGLSSNDIYLQFSRCTFDWHIRELLGTLLLGGTLVMIRSLEPTLIHKAIHEYSITIVNCVPSFIKLLCDTKNGFSWKSVKKITIGGEPLYNYHIELILNNLTNTSEIINSYGPAECTIETFLYKINPSTILDYNIPIGIPYSNVSCLILNKHLKLCGINQLGELYIGGKCVMKGYYKDEIQTNKYIINHPKYGRIYKTGDICRLLKDGNIVYVGRSDFQVKIRGQRIEIGEIEEIIRLHIDIKDILIKKEIYNSNEYLIAYLIVKANNKNNWKEWCKHKIPSWMIPSYFVELDKWPLSVNGKINRKELVYDFNNTITNETELWIPQNNIEKQLYNILYELGINVDNITKNITEWGLTSLLLLRLIYNLQNFNINITLSEFIECNTIDDIINLIKLNI